VIDIIFRGTVKSGKANIYNQKIFADYLRSLEGQEVEIIVRKPRKIRTNQQNAWYWVCVVGIPAEHFGYTSEEMHEAYKFMFLRRHEEGKPETVRSTTTLTTKEFGDFVDKCIHWCAEQGISIPGPKEIV
jgi:hypothetical protein